MSERHDGHGPRPYEDESLHCANEVFSLTELAPSDGRPGWHADRETAGRVRCVDRRVMRAPVYTRNLRLICRANAPSPFIVSDSGKSRWNRTSEFEMEALRGMANEPRLV